MMRRLVVGAILAGSVVAAVPAAADEAGLDFRVQRLSDRVVIFTEVSPWESNPDNTNGLQAIERLRTE